MSQHPAPTLSACNACEFNEADPADPAGLCTECRGSSPAFGKTEAQRRIRELGRAARRSLGLPANAKVEVGVRTFPVACDHEPSPAEQYHPSDDLAYNVTIEEASTESTVAAHGAVVHLYCYRQQGTPRYPDWELYDTLCGWIGTPEQPPVLVDRRA